MHEEWPLYSRDYGRYIELKNDFINLLNKWVELRINLSDIPFYEEEDEREVKVKGKDVTEFYESLINAGVRKLEEEEKFLNPLSRKKMIMSIDKIFDEAVSLYNERVNKHNFHMFNVNDFIDALQSLCPIWPFCEHKK